MKIKTLLIGAACWVSLTAQAQIHPASLWNNTFIYNAVPHVNETWTASGYTLYNITMVKDANGYITSIQTSSPPPFNTSVDQYQSTGSRTGTVFTASTQKQLKNTTAWFNWRKETWQGDGTKDTAVMWQDSINGAWTYVVKHVLHYTGTDMDLSTDYTWSNSTWNLSSKMVLTYISGKKDKLTNYDWKTATSSWLQTGYVQYYYSTKLDSLLSWKTDPVTAANTISQKYYFTTDASSGKTKTLTAYDWDATNSAWKTGISIAFVAGTPDVTSISQNSEKVKVYPSPTNQVLKIDFAGNGNLLKLHIRDILGNEIVSVESTTDHTEINTGELKSGFYLFSVEQNGKLLDQRKLIIAH